ncbi:hypothetical protein NDU88_008117 [Pleurodeles waltl]|uniref:Uncharacterized protein n=1 Tax=Pleurodeles waltl TaxID=8319 RepID=A0AAV7NY78_PLEWA|nr:hypothetical protein NDU88_008117 [Pleurodeles waltl]
MATQRGNKFYGGQYDQKHGFFCGGVAYIQGYHLDSNPGAPNLKGLGFPGVVDKPAPELLGVPDGRKHRIGVKGNVWPQARTKHQFCLRKFHQPSSCPALEVGGACVLGGCCARSSRKRLARSVCLQVGSVYIQPAGVAGDASLRTQLARSLLSACLQLLSAVTSSYSALHVCACQRERRCVSPDGSPSARCADSWLRRQ